MSDVKKEYNENERKFYGRQIAIIEGEKLKILTRVENGLRINDLWDNKMNNVLGVISENIRSETIEIAVSMGLDPESDLPESK